MLQRVAAQRRTDIPNRFSQWNATVRAGDTLKLAFTLVNEDGETPAYVGGAYARLSVYPEPRNDIGWRHGDYGFGWATSCGRALYQVDGWVWDASNGRINFVIPNSVTWGCGGRYLVFLEVDQPDGVSTVLEGLLRVQHAPAGTLGNAARAYMEIGGTPIGSGMFPPGVINEIPVDNDGFPLPYLVQTPVVTPPASGFVLGTGILGQMTLGSDASSGNALLGSSIVGQMILGS